MPEKHLKPSLAARSNGQNSIQHYQRLALKRGGKQPAGKFAAPWMFSDYQSGKAVTKAVGKNVVISVPLPLLPVYHFEIESAHRGGSAPSGAFVWNYRLILILTLYKVVKEVKVVKYMKTLQKFSTAFVTALPLYRFGFSPLVRPGAPIHPLCPIPKGAHARIMRARMHAWEPPTDRGSYVSSLKGRMLSSTWPST